MIKKKYVHPHIELCTQCEGSGTISVYKEDDILRLTPEPAVCGTCMGTGRVIISSATTITITPFSSENNL